MSDYLNQLEANRSLFVSRNIMRTRELLRYLPEERYTLFQIIPFLLHVNLPAHPGYIESPEAEPFFGLHRFDQSGFFKTAVERFNLSGPATEALKATRGIIEGVYLMGSVGTLTQSEKSDFDYWLVVDESRVSASARGALQKKVEAVSDWCLKEFGQEVTFFIMGLEQLRNNDFSTVDSESSGSAQKTLLKEEFYRTFIVLSGKIPLWAVLPADISPMDYSNAAREIAGSDIYVDTGDLEKIDPKECLGAVLWQINKAGRDPVKALIKATLACYYFFNHSQRDTMVCNIVKSRMVAALDDHSADPNTIVFEAAETFYKDMDDIAGLHLLQETVLMRLLGYPAPAVPDADTPKGVLFEMLASKWRLKREKLDRLKSFSGWPESEKLVFEGRIYDRLSFLYELIMRSTDSVKQINMKKDDLAILVNRTAAQRQKLDGKLQPASCWLKKQKKRLRFEVIGDIPDVDENRKWRIRYIARDGVEHTVYQGLCLVDVIGWLLMNVYNDDARPSIVFLDGGSGRREVASEQKLKQATQFVSGFFPRPDSVYEEARRVEKVLVCLTATRGSVDSVLHSAEFLMINSWGEFFVRATDLSHLERKAQKCYKIADTIFHLLKHTSSFDKNYLICHSHGDNMNEYKVAAEKYLREIFQSVMSEKNIGSDAPADPEPEGKHKPFLDLL